MNVSIKIFAVAALALFALSGCSTNNNKADDGDDTSSCGNATRHCVPPRPEESTGSDLSKQGEDNGGTSVKPPIGGGDPMPPPTTKPTNYEPDTTNYKKEPEKEPPQQQPIDPTKIVTWSKEVDKWIMNQHQIDPKEQEQREVWILDADTGSIRAKVVLTADGVRRLEGGFYVIFPEEYNS
jgi:hypothetical protein